jgi:hypothetical protein
MLLSVRKSVKEVDLLLTPPYGPLAPYSGAWSVQRSLFGGGAG